MNAASILDDIRFNFSTVMVYKSLSVLNHQLPKYIHDEDWRQFCKLGFLKLSAFLDVAEIEKLQVEIKNISTIFREKKTSDIEEKPGNIKFKNLHKYSKVFDDFRKNKILSSIATLCCGYPKNPSVLYTFTTDGKCQNNIVAGACKKQIASDPHVDSYKNYLKIAICMSDVSTQNGPTSIIPGSKSDRLLQPIYSRLRADGRSTIVSSAVSEKLVKKYGIEKCVGKAGDIFILNTKNLHWAGELSSGTRELLWFYY
jgi:hypothetical protein